MRAAFLIALVALALAASTTDAASIVVDGKISGAEWAGARSYRFSI